MWTTLFSCLLSCPALVAGDPFTELSFDAAVEKANKEQKLLLIDFTAEWCAPCKKMEKDTWAAAEVGAWLADNALALQVDVDDEPDFSQRFGIEAMPTVVALRDGKEFDRFIGYKDAQGFLEWGREVRAGKRASDGLRVRSLALKDSSDVRERHSLARELLRAKLYEEALVHYSWLWPASRDESSYAGVRLSFLLKEMAELGTKYEPAQQAFGELLEGLQAAVEQEAGPSLEAWREWVSFCKYFGQSERMLAWYEKHRDEGGSLFGERQDPLASALREDVFEHLMDRNRLQEAARLFSDPVERARKLVEQHQQRGASGEMDEELRASVTRVMEEQLTKGLVRLFIIALVVDRPQEAQDVAALLLRTIDTPGARIALAQGALQKARKPLPAVAHWLDEAEAGGSSVKGLRRKLERLQKDK